MREAGVFLLHNMSCCSTTVISHRGRRLEDIKQVVFSLPAGSRVSTPEEILKLLRCERGKRADAARELRALLNGHALNLPYPAAALVRMEGLDPNATIEKSLLTICTVLSKSGDRLYLRDKEPNFGSIRPRRIALLIPGGMQ
jgi:hypothetical protein